MSEIADLQKIEPAARQFAAQFSGFLKACEFIGRIASLEQAHAEARGRLENAQAEEARLLERRKAEHEAADQALAEKHRQAIADHQAHCATLLANAQKGAEQIIKDAHDGAVAAEASKRFAETALGEHQAALADIKTQRDQTFEQIKIHRQTLDALKAELAADEERLAAVKAELAALRSKLA